jgi:putative Holliday junction resolvase
MGNTNLNRILALDVGDARIGVALSDPLGNFAQPWSSVENSGKAAHKEIVRLIRENQVQTVVCGLPIELDGGEGPQAEKVRKFGTKLENIFKSNKDLHHCSLLYWDERFTSTAADRVLIGSKLKNADRRAARDRVSAALILESYLNSIRS